MKSIALLAGITGMLWLSSCEEDSAVPAEAIVYVNLNDRAVAYNQSQTIDLDGEGQPELSFSAILAQENGTNQLQYRVYPLRANQVFEVAGRALKLVSGQEIAPGNPFDKNVAPMVTRIEQNQAVAWQGDWLDANRNYLGFSVQLQDGLRRYGWVRISFDRVSEKLILHDAAYQQQPQRALVAGQLAAR